MVKSDEVVEVMKISSDFCLFFLFRDSDFKLRILLCVHSWLSRTLRCHRNVLIIFICQRTLKYKFSIIFFPNSGSNQKSSIVNQSIGIPINIGFSNACTCSSEQNISFCQFVIFYICQIDIRRSKIICQELMCVIINIRDSNIFIFSIVFFCCCI